MKNKTQASIIEEKIKRNEEETQVILGECFIELQKEFKVFQTDFLLRPQYSSDSLLHQLYV